MKKVLRSASKSLFFTTILHFSGVSAQAQVGTQVTEIVTDFDGTETLEGIRLVYFDNTPLFNVFPNPAQDILHITGENIDRIEVYDVSGQLYHTENQLPGTAWFLNTETLADGIYYFKISTSDRYTVKKVLIVHP